MALVIAPKSIGLAGEVRSCSAESAYSCCDASELAHRRDDNRTEGACQIVPNNQRELRAPCRGWMSPGLLALSRTDDEASAALIHFVAIVEGLLCVVEEADRGGWETSGGYAEREKVGD